MLQSMTIGIQNMKQTPMWEGALRGCKHERNPLAILLELCCARTAFAGHCCSTLGTTRSLNATQDEDLASGLAAIFHHLAPALIPVHLLSDVFLQAGAEVYMTTGEKLAPINTKGILAPSQSAAILLPCAQSCIGILPTHIRRSAQHDWSWALP